MTCLAHAKCIGQAEDRSRWDHLAIRMVMCVLHRILLCPKRCSLSGLFKVPVLLARTYHTPQGVACALCSIAARTQAAPRHRCSLQHAQVRQCQ